MLMVLMALIDLGRSGLARFFRWVSMVLSGGLFAGSAGCLAPGSEDASSPVDVVETSTPEDSVAPDGTAPDPSPSDGALVDQISGTDLPTDCPQVTYYGPQPCETDEDCRQRYGAGWYCDTANVFTDPCGGSVTWPLCRQGDAVEPLDVVPADLPADVSRDCEPVVAYGPPPCTSDDDCKGWGENYYCDKSHPISDPCTGSQWYLCTEGTPSQDVVEGQDLPSVDAADAEPADGSQDGVPVVLYGPPPPNPSR
ncbi:MAG TPA: hypothetical protein PLQ97_05970 [Myxococcota bacterium]|nr:hypothetical protein [Myxococcota bacterium]HQK50210.1 hypothetical protein [Myxococcota bacterium]